MRRYNDINDLFDLKWTSHRISGFTFDARLLRNPFSQNKSMVFQYHGQYMYIDTENISWLDQRGKKYKLTIKDNIQGSTSFKTLCFV
jgi:hypothetical protein